MMPPEVVRGVRNEQTVPAGSSTIRSTSASPVQETTTRQSRIMASFRAASKALGFLRALLFLELLERGGGHAIGLAPQFALLLGPGLAEDAHRGPTNGFHVLELLGQGQAVHVRLVPRRFAARNLAEQLQARACSRPQRAM